jgi:hypothetical protein
VFERRSGVWVETHKLLASDREAHDALGR